MALAVDIELKRTAPPVVCWIFVWDGIHLYWCFLGDCLEIRISFQSRIKHWIFFRLHLSPSYF